MSDGAHVQTKAAQSLSESRDISVIQITNPTSSPITEYRTSIDPALVAAKLIPVDSRVLDLNNEPVPSWYCKYGTGVSSAEILHKSSILSGGMQQVLLGDAPYVRDIGAMIDVPDVPVSLDDNWHKIVTTDLSSCDHIVASGVQAPSLPFMSPSTYRSQDILFPVSSRHIVKTPDGALHVVCAYIISGLSRIVYMKSVNGGETWSSTIVDNDDGHHYVMPAITRDKNVIGGNSGIHITYSRWDQVDFDTFWLYCGTTIPDGFELISNSGNIAHHRLLGGGDGTYYPTLAYNPDDGYIHGHSSSLSSFIANPEVGRCLYGGYSLYGHAMCATNGAHHPNTTLSIGTGNALPSSRSLKLLRYYGIPQSLPVDIIVPFKSNVPTGYTRYSDHDGYYVYCSDDVGTVVGSSTHYHVFDYDLTKTGVYGADLLGSPTPIDDTDALSHAHVGSHNIPSVTNSLLHQGVIFGKITSPRSILPVDSLLLGGSSPLLSKLTCLSDVGESLYDKYLFGASSYSDLGGNSTHDHANETFYTCAKTYGGYYKTSSDWDVMMAGRDHTHKIIANYSAEDNDVSFFKPYISQVDTELDLTTYGNDLFYRYISPTGVFSAPVNISLINRRFMSFEGNCLCDGSDNVHFIWSAQGLNTTPGKSRISYKKMTSGSLGPRIDLTTDDNHMLFPSMDIDSNDCVHAAWFNATTNQSLEYRKSGPFGFDSSIEVIDSSSYVGYPSNIATDADCNVFLMYAKWVDADTAIKEVFYRKRTSGGWGAAVNLSPDKASSGYNQAPGQIYIDNKGNVIFTWMGKGYGAHTGVYHPVYRYLSLSDSITPDLSSDATDVFPDDDTEMIYPIVFWHSYPLVDSVYQNLVSSGLSFMYLYDPRNGATRDTADLKFYSSPNALVGDVGLVGQGGTGIGDFTPGGISAESILQSDSFSAVMRGYIGKSPFTLTTFGNYLV